MTRRAHGLLSAATAAATAAAATTAAALATATAVAVAALAILLWDVDRPALWLDESASIAATTRTWPDLWHLLGGADAPLVPYYALLKAVTSAVTAVDPGLAAAPELLFRLPSLVATAVAAWALAFWLARRWSIALALTSTSALLVTAGFSRYGQEARPYAWVLLAAVTATITWATMVSSPRRRWIVLYALSVVLLVATHLLAGTLIAAHAITALIATPDRSPDRSPERNPEQIPPGWAQRRSAIGRTVIGAALGLALVAPFAWPASGHGVGPTKVAPVTWEHLSTAFLNLFTFNTQLTAFAGFTSPFAAGPFLGVGVLLVMSVLGLSQTVMRRYRFIARLAATWALVPPLVLLPVVTARPNLIIGRYLVFVIPGWTVLAGLGVVTVADLVRRRSGGSVAASRAGGAVRAVTGSLTIVLLLSMMVADQTSTLTAVRTPAGHSEDLRPALALADRPEYASLPIVLTSLYSSLEIAAYRRADESRLIGQHVPRDGLSIWPVEYADAQQQTVRHPRLVLLLRAPTPARCRARWPGTASEYVQHCLPRWLRQQDYQVETAHDAGYRWTFAVLTQPAQPYSPKIPKPAPKKAD